MLRAFFLVGDKGRYERNPVQAAECVETLQNVTPVANFVETMTIIVKTCAPYVKNVVEVAESVADVAKCMSIVSSVVTVVGMCATLVEMRSESKRDAQELPGIRSTIQELQDDIVAIMVPILHPVGKLDELLVRGVFEIQEQLFDVLARSEKFMMRNVVAWHWNAGELEEVEEALAALRQRVVDVRQCSRISPSSDLKQYIDSDHMPLRAAWIAVQGG